MTGMIVFILKLTRMGLRLCAISAAAVLVIEIGKNLLSGTSAPSVMPDYAFLAIVLFLLIGSLALAHAITREIKRMHIGL